jgi:hypothetical protein
MTHDFAEPDESVVLDAAPVERRCDRCGGVNPIAWHAPSPLWNAVMRAATRTEVGFCCPRCFIEVAQEQGIDGSWHLDIDGRDWSVVPATDGRVWDSATCRWAPAPPVLDATAVLGADGLAMLDASLADDSPGIPVEEVKARLDAAGDSLLDEEDWVEMVFSTYERDKARKIIAARINALREVKDA